MIRPYGDHVGDGLAKLDFTLECAKPAAALELAERLGLEEPQLIHAQPLTGEHTHYIVSGTVTQLVNPAEFQDDDPQWMEDEVIEKLGGDFGRKIVIVGAATGSDTHTVGLDAILNVKGYHGHHGLEAYKCFEVHNLGSQVPNAVLLRKAEEVGADAILVSQTVTQQRHHEFNLRSFGRMAAGKTTVLIAGGPYITDKEAKSYGFDAGFGKGTLPHHVATHIIRAMCERRVDLIHEQARRRAA